MKENKVSPRDRSASEEAKGFEPDSITAFDSGYRFSAVISTNEEKRLSQKSATAKLETAAFALRLSSEAPNVRAQETESLVILRKSECCTLSVSVKQNAQHVEWENDPQRYRIATPCCTADIDVSRPDALEDIPDTSQSKFSRFFTKIQSRLGLLSYSRRQLDTLLDQTLEASKEDRKSLARLETQLEFYRSSRSEKRSTAD